MSIQSDPHSPAALPLALAAAARLRSRIAASRRSDRWLPAFQRDWERAMAAATDSYTFAPVHEVLRTWERRVRTEAIVDADLEAGAVDDDGMPLEDVIGPRR